MKLYEVYKHKKNNNLIQIDSFASHVNDSQKRIIIFRNIEKHNEFEYGSCPSFNGYGTKEEIENEYDLFVKQEELNNFDNWDEIFDLIGK